MATIERLFALDHPAAAGHFPGNPIIPGALLLSETLRAIEQGLTLDLANGQPVSAKFLHPVRPGDNVRIEFSQSTAGKIKFTGAVGQNVVLTGTVGSAIAWTPA